MKTNRLTLEVIINFRDEEENRQSPVCNRINIPLQVSEISKDVRCNISRSLLGSVISTIQRNEYLYPLVRNPSLVERLVEQGRNPDDKFLGLVAFPNLDNIEIQEIQRTSQDGDLS